MANNPLSDIFMMGIEKETYEEMLEIAKKKNKSVAEVASQAIREHLQTEKGLNESTQRRILTD
jgi:predicted HicB family RNase H-like nuclease